MTEKSKALRTNKAKRIQHHQTSSTTNAKGTSLSGKYKRRKGPTKTERKKEKGRKEGERKRKEEGKKERKKRKTYLYLLCIFIVYNIQIL